MRDLLPEEVEVRDGAIATILDVYRRHGFVRVETPAVESLGLLMRSEGGENEKLIFKILKRGEKLVAAAGSEDWADLGLRFDLTVPLARYYAHNHAKLPQPLKAIQIGPVWRAERPQHGRFRQFTQCDIDILGLASPVAEMELILATTEALLALGLEDLTVRLNDRRILTALARQCGFEEARCDSVFIALDKLDKIGTTGVIAELEEAGHPSRAIALLMGLLDEVTGAAWRLERPADAVGDDAEGEAVRRSLRRIIEMVEQGSDGRFRLRYDPTLVRGMGYYTGPIFEIQHKEGRASIAGGGRYDRMIGRLLGRDVPATGFSIGFERVVGLLLGRPRAPRAAEDRVALVFEDEATPLARALAMARELRSRGSIVLLEVRSKKAGKQLADLEARGYRRIAVFEADGSHRWREPRLAGGSPA
jgi:histidyl-tRNA synthetase